MDADQVAQMMLDMYKTEDDWCPSGLYMRRNGKDVHCLLGGRAIIQYGSLDAWSTDTLLKALADDEYLLKLAAVIREQYPEMRKAFTLPADMPSLGKDLWDQLNVIFVFNDGHATFADIRTVLEKAAVR